MDVWRATLANGDPTKAWDLFIVRYRRLILSVIRRSIADADDVSDVFGEVCADLSSDNFRRIAGHTDSGKARFSTWLVTVVHHRTIDWIRHRDGRRRIAVPAGLSPLQEKIFNRVICEQHSHVAAYELIRQQPDSNLTFRAFMKEVTATFQTLERVSGKTVTKYFPGQPATIEQAQPGPDDVLMSSDSSDKLHAALETLSPEERLAVQLFVVDEMPADAVARTVGWPNAKSVYNRVYRALGVLRRELQGSDLDEK